MDSGEVNKILGGVLGAVLVFLLLGFFSELIYHGAGGHDGEDRVLAFAVEVEDAGGGEAEEEVVDFAGLLAQADAGSGASVFNKCKACHNLEDGANAVGPHLHGVVGRAIAGVEGFAYSDALMAKEGEWNVENLFNFIHNPSGWAPGTKMGFAGLPDHQDKMDLIVFLNEESGAEPVELVVPETPAGAGEETAEGAEGAGEETAEAGAAAPAEGEGASGEGGGQAALIASADPAAGEKVFNKCKACHRLEEGANAVGPHLWGVVGREIAAVEGFSYSDALAGKEGAWDFETLSAFLHDPQGWAPGTMMGFAGLEDDQDRADVIAYLNQQSDSPVELGAAAPAEEVGEVAQAEGEAAEVSEEAVGDDEIATEGAPAAAAGEAPEVLLLETADDAGRKGEDTEERDALDKGVPSDASPVKDVELKDEEEAEAKLDVAAEGGVDDSERYTEQQAGTDEVDTTFVPESAVETAPETEIEEPAAAIEPAEDAEEEPEAVIGAEPGSAGPVEPEEVVDPEVETETRVVTDPTSALTEILDEDRVDPLPDADAAAEEATTATEESTGADAAEGADDEAAEAAAAEAAKGAATAADGAFAPLLAEASADEGEKLFRRCQACHRLEDGRNTIGPHLYGVVGREIAGVADYRYSDALAGKQGVWDLAMLDAFLTDPTGWAPGTKMSFAGIDDAQDRVDLITYLNQVSGDPVDLGTAPGGAAFAEAAQGTPGAAAAAAGD